MISPHDWLEAIKEDIRKKYSVGSPEFLVDGMSLDKKTFDEWLKKYVESPYHWIQYKHIKDDIFELKPFAPYPDEKVSKKIIDAYLQALSKTEKENGYMVTYIDEEAVEIVGDSIYDEEEIKTELLYLFRLGWSKISFYKEPEEKDNKIRYHFFVEEDSLENMLKTGYLRLEYPEESE